MREYCYLGFDKIDITGGFWKKRQEINKNVTLMEIYDRFTETHRIEAWDCNWREGLGEAPHIYWDSDVAKWIEGVAYILSAERNESVEKLCDRAIDNLVKNQEESGYFNSHYLVTEKSDRFKIRRNHELYCAGHLFEAACAYYKATGKDKLLKAMYKYADYIYDVFYIYKEAAFETCAHPEIEIGLVKLADISGNNKYLELAKHFADVRGNNSKDRPGWGDHGYFLNHEQSLKPLKSLEEAQGHCVMALYMYCAMADLADKYGDEEYFATCERLFDNITEKRMFITGGVGSTEVGEAFTIDYHLPNNTAYAETCASIALGFFAKRMGKIKPDSKYADIVEKVMYNGVISGISLDGRKFFYQNPLEIDPYFNVVNTCTAYKKWMPGMERHVIGGGCECCPPNVLRFIASIGDTFYTYNEDTVFIHQYADCEAAFENGKIIQRTAYPSDGKVELKIEGTFTNVAVRIPGWCESYDISRPYTVKDGYAYIAVPDNGLITLDFHMPVQLIESNLQVQDNTGKVAVMRGPLVYCMESVDNGPLLRSLSLVEGNHFTLEFSEEYNVPVLKTKGVRKIGNKALYSRYNSNYEETELQLIPFFAFANRGVAEMNVWFRIK